MNRLLTGVAWLGLVGSAWAQSADFRPEDLPGRVTEADPAEWSRIVDWSSIVLSWSTGDQIQVASNGEVSTAFKNRWERKSKLQDETLRMLRSAIYTARPVDAFGKRIATPGPIEEVNGDDLNYVAGLLEYSRQHGWAPVTQVASPMTISRRKNSGALFGDPGDGDQVTLRFPGRQGLLQGAQHLVGRQVTVLGRQVADFLVVQDILVSPTDSDEVLYVARVQPEQSSRVALETLPTRQRPFREPRLYFTDDLGPSARDGRALDLEQRALFAETLTVPAQGPSTCSPVNGGLLPPRRGLTGALGQLG